MNFSGLGWFCHIPSLVFLYFTFPPTTLQMHTIEMGVPKGWSPIIHRSTPATPRNSKSAMMPSLMRCSRHAFSKDCSGLMYPPGTYHPLISFHILPNFLLIVAGHMSNFLCSRSIEPASLTRATSTADHGTSLWTGMYASSGMNPLSSSTTFVIRRASSTASALLRVLGTLPPLFLLPVVYSY